MMKFADRTATLKSQRRGVVTVLSGVICILLIAAAAFTIDIAYMHLVQTELQTATDAAARAATVALGNDQNVDAARTAATTVGGKNSVAGQPLILGVGDIVFGSSSAQSDGTFSFDPDGRPVNSVQVTGRRSKAANSAVSLFLGPLLGRDYFEPRASAVATRIDRDICIVVDRSQSMSWDLSGSPGTYPANSLGMFASFYPPLPGSRWGSLDAAVNVFTNAMIATPEDEQVALVSYSSDFERVHSVTGATLINFITSEPMECEAVTTHLNLTTNAALVTTKMTEIGSSQLLGQTNISAGLSRGLDVITDATFARDSAFKMIVLMTDGKWNEGTDPIDVAALAVAQNIVIHTITFSSNANEAEMIAVAAATGGKHYHAITQVELEAAFIDIAYSIPVTLTR